MGISVAILLGILCIGVPSRSQILFGCSWEKERGNVGHDICITDPQGSYIERMRFLFHGNSWIGSIDTSPDGKAIVFVEKSTEMRRDSWTMYIQGISGGGYKVERNPA